MTLALYHQRKGTLSHFCFCCKLISFTPREGIANTECPLAFDIDTVFYRNLVFKYEGHEHELLHQAFPRCESSSELQLLWKG
jgi:hypothetical protein